MTKQYSPNFNDPRVYERVAKAIAFVKTYLNTDKSGARPCAQSQIRKFIGQHELGEYLKRHLLICTNSFFSYDAHICKKYIINTGGVAFLMRQLETSTQSKHSTVLATTSVKTESQLKEQYSEDLANIAAGTLQYTLKSDRYWTPFQNIESRVRGSMLAEINFKHQYDTECAAPTLLYQRAQQLGLLTPTPAIDQYIAARASIRKELSAAVGISFKNAKTIINAMFCGAKIGASSYYQIFTLLDYNRTIIDKLKANPFIIQLKEDIRVMWKQITNAGLFVREYKTNPNTGKTRLIPISCGKKWKIYFNCERQITDTVISYFNKNGVKYVLEHDGWTTNTAISTTAMIDYISNNTGFKVKLEHTQLEKICIESQVATAEHTHILVSKSKQIVNSFVGLFKKLCYIAGSNNKTAGILHSDPRPVLALV